MAGELVNMATSDKPKEMDWRKNIEICELVAHDQGQAKYAIKKIKKRLRSKYQNTQVFSVMPLPNIVRGLWESLLCYLTSILGNDFLALQCVLLHLLSRVETIPYEALRCSICDIKSVVRMCDTVSGSAPGNTSRSSIGEDLAATTKWHLQAKTFISQNESATNPKTK